LPASAATHDYFYIRDEVLGPMAMRVATFFPFDQKKDRSEHQAWWAAAPGWG
jgi:hypothetical protein